MAEHICSRKDDADLEIVFPFDAEYRWYREVFTFIVGMASPKVFGRLLKYHFDLLQAHLGDLLVEANNELKDDISIVLQALLFLKRLHIVKSFTETANPGFLSFSCSRKFQLTIVNVWL